ncbi:GTA-gp10 family protein [Pelagerythrobacter aerophilus]|uniref:Gene transfer agent family protein n=1 Tax=Pelagerythrobacter aerophilus TaxID=2306995 RepID=A0A418NJU1_9SPHN|nr:GTA-gp10 family protein [Pelagerythrobacter aerophilus]RIV79581.1 hypothetical protein D2V04_06320 [Pelagerythrobacter aerophilus]
MELGVTEAFGDGKYHFKLTWTGCAAVEKAAGGVPFERLVWRFYEHQAGIAEIEAVIRQGLLGGDGGEVREEPVKLNTAMVDDLVRAYVTGPDRRPIIESRKLAAAIVIAAYQGYEPAQTDAKKSPRSRRTAKPDRHRSGPRELRDDEHPAE